MSVIRGSIAAHQRLQLDRRRARMQAEEMWDDAAGRKYFDVLDGLDELAVRDGLGIFADAGAWTWCAWCGRGDLNPYGSLR